MIRRGGKWSSRLWCGGIPKQLIEVWWDREFDDVCPDEQTRCWIAVSLTFIWIAHCSFEWSNLGKIYYDIICYKLTGIIIIRNTGQEVTQCMELSIRLSTIFLSVFIVLLHARMSQEIDIDMWKDKYAKLWKIYFLWHINS